MLAAFLLATAVLWAAIFALLQSTQREAMQRATTVGQNLARTVAETESASIQSLDLLVQHFRKEWIHHRDEFPAMVEWHREFLARSSVVQVGIISADGRLAFSNVQGWTPVDLSDREHFKVHKARGTDELFVSAPVLGRVTKQWTIQFTRPIFDERKQFAGVIVFSVLSPALERLLKVFDLGEGVIISLARFDGQIVAHSRDIAQASKVSLAGSHGLLSDEPEAGEFQRKSYIDGTMRLYRYQKVTAYPFTVFVGQDVPVILAQYNRLRTLYFVVGALVTALMLAIMLLLIGRYRKNEEAQRNKVKFQEELHQSDERCRLIAETIDAVFWSADIFDRCSFYVSPAYARIWKRDISSLESGLHPLAESVHEADRQRVLADLELKKEIPFEHEYRIVHPDGSVHWIWGRGFPVRNDAGQITRYVGLAKDVTARKLAEEKLSRFNDELEQRVEERTTELQAANAALLDEKELHEALIKKLEEAQNQLLQSEKMASIGQLAAGVAHEINNPIGFVSSNLGALQRYSQDMLKLLQTYEQAEGSLTSEVQEELARLKHQIDFDYLREDLGKLLGESQDGLQRVKRIVQDLKDFSHAGDSERVWANLENGLESTLNVVWNEIKYKAMVIREYAGIPDIECIPSQLNQVFMNLLVNAAQAIKDKGQITVRTGSDDVNVWVEIADTGSGISPENMNRIFDPFFTTKPVGQGTGLGLSLSYSIVQKHGGRIEVSSVPGEGTTFRVVLPLSR